MRERFGWYFLGLAIGLVFVGLLWQARSRAFRRQQQFQQQQQQQQQQQPAPAPMPVAPGGDPAAAPAANGS